MLFNFGINFSILKKGIIYLGLFLLILLLLGCSRSVEFAGGGSEAENAIVVGVVENTEGSPVSNVEVQIIPAGYNPVSDSAIPDSFTVTTDSEGKFRFVVQDSGLYNILAHNTGDGSRAVHSQVAINKGEEITIPVVQLKQPVSVNIPLEGLGNNSEGQLYIPGLNYVIDLPPNFSDTSFLVIDSLPSDLKLPLVFSDTNTSSEIVIIAENTTDVSGEIELHPYSLWKKSLTLEFNTTASGADVQNNLFNIPILIRLNSNNFNFDSANSDGSDVRFAKTDRTKIPFEIESWDKENEQAIIWVTIDTLKGNLNSQAIHMFYGNPRVQSPGNKYQVFLQSSGFSGVYHLTESVLDTIESDLYQNAVRDEDHGDDKVHSSDQTGYIGKGAFLKGNDFIQVSNPSELIKADSQVTISAWMKVDPANTLKGTMITMGVSFGMRLNLNEYHGFVFYDSTFQSITTNGLNIRDGNWHYVATVYTGKELKVFVDGVLQKSLPKSGLLEYPKQLNDTTAVRPHLLIGKAGAAGPEVNFEGFIDEVRVSRVSRTDDWIKLVYENQKLGSNFIKIK